MPAWADGLLQGPSTSQQSSGPAPGWLRSWSSTESSRQLLTAERMGTVVVIHCALDARFQGKFQRTRDPVDDLRNALGFCFGEPPEDVMNSGLRPLGRGLADADPEANEFVSA